jgi:hypothetical protein
LPCPAPPCRARPHHPSQPLRAQACPTRPALPVSTCPALPSRPRHQLTFLPETTIHTGLQCFGGCRVALIALSFEGWHTSIEIPRYSWVPAACQSVEFGGPRSQPLRPGDHRNVRVARIQPSKDRSGIQRFQSLFTHSSIPPIRSTPEGYEPDCCENTRSGGQASWPLDQSRNAR